MRYRLSIYRLLPLFVIAGCGQAADTMRVAETISLADSSFSTLAIDASGTFWLGGSGAVVRLDSSTAAPRALPIEGEGVPEMIGAHGGRIYFRTPASLTLIHEGRRVGTVGTDPTDAAALDPLGRFVLTTSGAGTVVAYDAANLAPVWGWAAIGTRSAGLAVSPEGDRVYQAAGAYEFRERPQILVRELQTGRVMRRLEMPESVRALTTGRDGSLYGAGWEESEPGSVFALEWEGGEIGLAWTTSIERLGLTPPLEIATSPTGRVIGVLGHNETGLHLLEVETGRSIDRLIGPIADFAFDPDGRLWVLYAGELRRVE